MDINFRKYSNMEPDSSLLDPALTDADLGAVLGGNASDVTGSVAEHAGHVSSFATIGGAAGPTVGMPAAGAALGLAAGAAFELYEHNAEAINELEQQNRSNII